MSNDKKSDSKASIKLTDEQRDELMKIFGKEMVKRIETIEIEQISGYLKANAHVN